MVTIEDLTTDERIQRDVLEELHFDPRVRPTDVGVEVDRGIVTLTGTVNSYQKRWRAVEAVLRVQGVRGVANELAIQLPREREMDDTDIARAIAEALERSVEIPRHRIKVTVDQGRVTLEGTVDWYFEVSTAEQIVRQIKGVRAIDNLLEVRQEAAGFTSPEEIKLQIERALTRYAQLEAQHLQVTVDESRVTLQGHVRSWAEREAVEHAAWSRRDVSHVDNKIEVWP